MRTHYATHTVPVPCMCTPTELGRLRDYCRNEYTRRGDIVEFGPWLGGSTLAMLDGLQPTDKLWVVDNFIWVAWMDPHTAEKFEVGQSFLARQQLRLRRGRA